MNSVVLWQLPVPATALMEGPRLNVRLGRDVSIEFSLESDDGDPIPHALVFTGVEAFKCTYYQSRDPSTLEAYGRIIDRGRTAWLVELSSLLTSKRASAEGLIHMMIDFDDGPAYEFVCRGFRFESPVSSGANWTFKN